MYYLKLFDKTLLTFDMDNVLGLEIKNINIVEKNKNIYPIELQANQNEDTILDFVKSRFIPKNRAFIKQILETAGLNINDIKGIIDVCKGLSLTDSYWIVQDDSLKFDDYNLFDNDFSEILSLVAFTGYSSKVKGLITSPEFTTDGMLPKAWRRIDKEVYLYKGSTEIWHVSNSGFEPYSEYYTSQIEEKLGIEHVKYDLSKWKGMLVSICKLFTSKNISYVPIGKIVKTGGIKAVGEYLESMGLKDKFSDMILIDSLTMNTDRHFGNFGLLRDNNTGEFIDMAPIFDNGESLLCKADPNIFNNKEEFNKYISLPENNISYYGANYDTLVKTYCTKKQIENLRKMLTFKFNIHEKYNLNEERLNCLSNMIQERAKHFINILEKSENN